MWTVPACAKCNGGFSKDDDYFRTALTITEKVKGHAARDAILPTVMRGLNNPKARRHQVSLLSRSAVIERWSPGGVYLGRQRAIALDGRRLDRTATRIVTALYFRTKGIRLPDNHAVRVLHVSRMSQLSRINRELFDVARQFIALVKKEPGHIQGTAFAFKWIQSPNGAHNTMWLLFFYGKLEFYCTTAPA
jgi:hypothetical protein